MSLPDDDQDCFRVDFHRRGGEPFGIQLSMELVIKSIVVDSTVDKYNATADVGTVVHVGDRVVEVNGKRDSDDILKILEMPKEHPKLRITFFRKGSLLLRCVREQFDAIKELAAKVSAMEPQLRRLRQDCDERSREARNVARSPWEAIEEEKAARGAESRKLWRSLKDLRENLAGETRARTAQVDDLARTFRDETQDREISFARRMSQRPKGEEVLNDVQQASARLEQLVDSTGAALSGRVAAVEEKYARMESALAACLETTLAARRAVAAAPSGTTMPPPGALAAAALAPPDSSTFGQPVGVQADHPDLREELRKIEARVEALGKRTDRHERDAGHIAKLSKRINDLLGNADIGSGPSPPLPAIVERIDCLANALGHLDVSTQESFDRERREREGTNRLLSQRVAQEIGERTRACVRLSEDIDCVRNWSGAPQCGSLATAAAAAVAAAEDGHNGLSASVGKIHADCKTKPKQVSSPPVPGLFGGSVALKYDYGHFEPGPRRSKQFSPSRSLGLLQVPSRALSPALSPAPTATTLLAGPSPRSPGRPPAVPWVRGPQPQPGSPRTEGFERRPSPSSATYSAAAPSAAGSLIMALPPTFGPPRPDGGAWQPRASVPVFPSRDPSSPAVVRTSSQPLVGSQSVVAVATAGSSHTQPPGGASPTVVSRQGGATAPGPGLQGHAVAAAAAAAAAAGGTLSPQVRVPPPVRLVSGPSQQSPRPVAVAVATAQGVTTLGL